MSVRLDQLGQLDCALEVTSQINIHKRIRIFSSTYFREQFESEKVLSKVITGKLLINTHNTLRSPTEEEKF